MDAQAVEQALADLLARTAGPGQLQGLTRLTGGATKATWSFDWVDRAGGRQSLILQQTVARAAPSGGAGKSAPKLTGREDAELMIAAREAGIPAPRVLHVLSPEDSLGEGYVTERVEGETLGKRVVGDPAFAPVRPRLAAQCGEILAAIHALPTPRVPFLARLTAAEELSIYAGLLAPYGFVHPALSYAIRWIGERLPAEGRAGVVHADFRTGNLIVHPEHGVRCVLDWEIARIGDPMHDLGVLCMRSWRFGGAGECGGFGTREELYAAYEKASGVAVDPARVRFWEAFSNLKWAIACVRRGSSRGADGRPAGVELAAIGRRLEQPLWDFMALAGARS